MKLETYLRDWSRVFSPDQGQKCRAKSDSEHSDFGPVNMGSVIPRAPTFFAQAEKRVIHGIPDGVADGRDQSRVRDRPKNSPDKIKKTDIYQKDIDLF